ncbi:bacteriohemerythrin [Caenispirillum salinarum]|uniref:bacteriohemerythrin n=1 Tax=Caenispirillum salinarum TaxID=859058 RepID=UPI00384AEB07
MKRFLGIGGKILIASSLVIIGAVGAFAIYFDMRQQDEISTALQAKVDESGALATRSLENWIAGRVGLIENLADNVAADPSPEAVRTLISRDAMHERFMFSYFGSTEGEMIMYPPEDLPADYDPRARPWYQDAQRLGQSTITEPYRDASTGDLIVTVTTPVSADGRNIGVVGGDISLSAMIGLVRSIDLGGIGHGFMISGDDTVLIHPDDALTLKPLDDAFPGAGLSVNAGDGSVLHSAGDRLVAFMPIPGLPGVEWYLGLSIDREAAYAPLSAFRTTMIITTLILLGGMIALVGYTVRRLVLRPVNAMTRVMGELAEGNIEVPVPYGERSDEIGRMASSVKHFKEQLARVREMEMEKVRGAVRAEQHRKAALGKLVSSLEITVGEVARKLTGAAGEMQQSASGMAALAQQTSSQATTVSAAAEEASVNVQTVASAADQLSASSADIERQVSVSREIAAQATEEAKSTSAAIQALSDDVNKIGDVVNLITDIASQTNLLALNATIEAARAGEAGKGFAVVANEVKSLATQTARATEQIAGNIESVQGGTQRAVQAIDAINRVIERMAEISAGVSAAVEEQNSATAEIARSVDQASEGTKEVSRNIVEVERAASTTGESAGRIAESSGELSTQAGRLTAEVAGFVAQVRANKEDIKLIDWTDDLKTGITDIDAHHKSIIEELNSLAGEMLHGDGSAAAHTMLQKMKDEMAQHFRDEEAEMKKRGYADLEQHRAQHQKLLDRMATFERTMDEDTPEAVNDFFGYTADWLTHHIAKMDKPLVAFLNGRDGGQGRGSRAA